MKCRKCSYNLNKEDVFCPECGAKKSEQQSKVYQHSDKLPKYWWFLGGFGIIILVIVLVVFIKIPQSQKEEIVCNPPYIKVGTSCCLDQNEDKVCDKEVDEQKLIINEPKSIIKVVPTDAIGSNANTEELEDNKFKILKNDAIILDNFFIYNEGDADAKITSSDFKCKDEFGQNALIDNNWDYRGVKFELRQFGCNCGDFKCEVKNPEIHEGNPCEWGDKLDKIYRKGKANFLIWFKIFDKSKLPSTLVCTFELHWVDGDEKVTETYFFVEGST